jgi:hypothetical protein
MLFKIVNHVFSDNFGSDSAKMLISHDDFTILHPSGTSLTMPSFDGTTDPLISSAKD